MLFWKLEKWGEMGESGENGKIPGVLMEKWESWANAPQNFLLEDVMAGAGKSHFFPSWLE